MMSLRVPSPEPRASSPGPRVTGRVRVCYMAHAFAVGGAEEMVLNLVQHLPERFEPVVCCINQAGPIGEEIQRTGTPVAVLGLTPGLRHPWDVAGIRRYLRQTQPAIVHTFLLTASLYGRLAAILEHVPIVIGTEVNVYERKRRHHILAERMLMSKTDRVIVSANSVRDFYVDQVHADPAKIDVVYNAVDWKAIRPTMSREAMRASLGLQPNAKVAGVIARLTEQKGHRFLFQAMTTPALKDLQLIVVGDGDLREALKAEVRDLGLESRVHFLGARRDLGDLLAAMDVFAMPSLWEGLPLSMILAMGAAKPIVATEVAGIPEIVVDGETGWLVPAGNSLALATALVDVFRDRTRTERVATAARDFVLPRFGVDGYVDSVVGLYDQLVRLKPDATAVYSN